MNSLPGLWIPSPSMPRTNELPLFNHTLPQWATAMQADIVHRSDCSVHVSDADHSVTAGKLFGLIDGGEISLDGEFGEHSASHLAAGILAHDASVRVYAKSQGLRAQASSYFGCSVCAIMTCFLKFSTMFSSSRTSVGFLATVMVSILSCSLRSA